MSTARTLTFLLVAALAASGSAAQSDLLLSPDVPTTPDGATHQPWEVVRYLQSASSYSSELTVEGNPAVNAVHKLDQTANWLISVEAPSGLGIPGFTAEPRDVIQLDGTIGASFPYLDGSCLSVPFPVDADINALSQDGSALLLAFATPTTLGSTTYQPNQVLKFVPVGIGGECDWGLSGTWDLSTLSTTYHPSSARITGLDFLENAFMLVSFDVPVDLAPSTGPTTYLPGQIARWDFAAGTWSLHTDLQLAGTPGWPISSQPDGLSADGNPGQLSGSLIMGKSGTALTVDCPGSCTTFNSRFGLYEGTLSSLRSGSYDHRQISCGNTCPGVLEFTPGSGDRYYLMVTSNGNEEGSYGRDSAGVERPRAFLEADRCAPYQTLKGCP